MRELEAAEQRLRQLEAISAGQKDELQSNNDLSILPDRATYKPLRSSSGDSFSSAQDWVSKGLLSSCRGSYMQLHAAAALHFYRKLLTNPA